MSNQTSRSWHLPDGVDTLPTAEITCLELLRGKILRHFDLSGYDLVKPPPFEFLDSLDNDKEKDLSLSTFTLMDQISGRMLGLRSDMTSQLVRMDAFSLKASNIRRLCYCEELFLTRKPSLHDDRCPLKTGIELFGHRGTASNIEIIELMLETLDLATIDNISLNLGHTGIYQVLSSALHISSEQEQELFKAIQEKAIPDLQHLIANLDIPKKLANQLLILPELMGDMDDFKNSIKWLADSPPEIHKCLQELEITANILQQRLPNVDFGFDLAELYGYRYHRGLVFIAYSSSYGQSIARGGQYNGISNSNMSRPAIGFDMNIKTLAKLSRLQAPKKTILYTPWIGPDENSTLALKEKIKSLRQQGLHVVVDLTNAAPQPDAETKSLVWNQDSWQIV